ncbi:MAG TPA: phosphatase RsbU N-terminal domain-containing protein [Solirubrobacterales bacterium]|nr:phosphatase RsbU N-terminal domain-containing protein [Actinoplanes sp.]HET6759911.1 phosphatase RsbU N-terminal domain-containing protein [Propionibacteriaceae bacterium]HEX2462528.1 phosphatase RsbU N-terminal domain-containing protein [Vicinamibacterales bacterium]HET9304374.1 phosphatase RsbU N-terminal domain-containing protein [Propionibacteriaceae bacterium]HEU4908818.1 phosphatase RsbU N-terminal domain-containing protein [Propionibacteriaceae bacterium]
MNALERLRRNYRAAFLRYLPNRDEAALDAGYQIGRSAVVDGLTILDLVQVHHDVLREVLGTGSPEELDGLTATAGDFLVEVLATYEMTRRGYLAKS